EEKSAQLTTTAPTDSIDVTLPSRLPNLGHLHPTTIVRLELEQIFREMGYSIDPGPEVETDWYNFEALNFTPDHPARDTQDTFFLDADKLLLRTHTSNVQLRSMERVKPPVMVLSCGRVYRRDEITMRRSPMFHQAEGFLVDRGIHIGHLRATLEHFIHRVFGPELQMRMRPSFFPFTEPSAEVDMSCVFCKGAGCGTCSQTGWMEILGCGMIQPQVLRNVGIDPEEWSGFAFGLGLDLVARTLNTHPHPLPPDVHRADAAVRGRPRPARRHQRNHAAYEGERRHQDRAQAVAVGLADRLRARHPLGAQPVRVIDLQYPVL